MDTAKLIQKLPSWLETTPPEWEPYRVALVAWKSAKAEFDAAEARAVATRAGTDAKAAIKAKRLVEEADLVLEMAERPLPELAAALQKAILKDALAAQAVAAGRVRAERQKQADALEALGAPRHEADLVVNSHSWGMVRDLTESFDNVTRNIHALHAQR